MKHVLIITTSYPTASDGSEAAGSFVQDFAEALAAQVRVTVLAPGLSNDDDTGNPVHVVRYQGAGKPLSLLKIWNPCHWPAIFRILRDGARQADHLCRDGTVDHIFALWVLPCGAWARQAGRRHGIAYSTWALGSDIWSLGKIPVVRHFLKKVLRDSHSNFADGHLLCRDVERLSGAGCRFLPSTRRFTPVQPTHAPPHQGVNLAFLGRWHPNKGTDLLLAALASLNDEDWAAIHAVRIFGGGPLQESVVSEADKLTAAGRPVSRGGYLDKQGAAELFAWADWILIPSRIESIPVVFSDAVKAGKPVIASPVGDLPDLLAQYRCGIVASEVSADSFAAAIRQALTQAPGQYDDGIATAAAAFSLENITRDFLNCTLNCTLDNP